MGQNNSSEAGGEEYKGENGSGAGEIKKIS